MATYTLLASEQTVRVLAPTVTSDVLYCTIMTHPSSSVVSLPIPVDATGVANGNPELTAYANAVEQIMARDEVVAAVGSQELDPSGLTTDYVIFTVQYVQPGTTGTSVTADAKVHSASLNFEDGQIGSTLLASVLAIIEDVYNGLKSTAGQ